MAKAKRATNVEPRIANRKAYHDYHVHESLEVGVALLGSEVKSIRASQVSLGEGFARVEPATTELFLYNVDIAPYAQAGPAGHEPKRPRKLLAHKRQIDKLLTATSAKGFTLIPLAMYFVRGKVKLEIGVCSGKRQHDRREDMKKKDADKSIRQAMTRKRL
jgi:SsrA-binding protein